MHFDFKKYIIVLFSIISTFHFLSCDVKSPIENVKAIINSEPLAGVMAVEFVDAKTLRQISGVRITLRIGGVNADDIVDLTKSPKKEFITDQGLLNFAVRDGLFPSPDNPVNITLIAEADGYLTNSQPVAINTAKGQSITMFLVSKTNLPDCAYRVIDERYTLGPNSTVDQNIIVSVDDPERKVTTSLFIPSGTKITDRFNNDLVPGKLSIAIYYFSNQCNSSLLSFPGGFLVNTDQGRGYFTTGGFAAFEIIDENGNEGKRFDQDATIRIDVPAATINPETGSAVANGDNMPIYSYNNDEGSWYFQTDASLSGPDSYGNYLAEFTTDHLSWWNLDWFNSNICEKGLTVTFTGIFNTLSVRVKNAANGLYMFNGGYAAANNPEITLNNVPGGVPAIIEAYHGGWCQDVLLGSITVSDLCGPDQVLEVTTPPGAQGNQPEVRLKVQGYCPNEPDILIRPNVAVWLEVDCGWAFAGLVENGFIIFNNLVVGETYNFGIWYDNEWNEEAYTVGESNYDLTFEMPADICDDL